MLEIIAVIGLSRAIGALAESRGRSRGWFRAFAIIAWFLGEIGGAVVGGVTDAVMKGGNPGDPNMALIYGCGIGGALLATASVFLVLLVMGKAPVMATAPAPWRPGGPPAMPPPIG